MIEQSNNDFKQLCLENSKIKVEKNTLKISEKKILFKTYKI